MTTAFVLTACGKSGLPIPADVNAPVVSFSPTVLSIESELSASATVTATDDREVTSGPSVTCTNGGSFNVTTNSFTAATITEETESICTATASDKAGNQGTAILTVTMTPPPDVTAPDVSFNPATLSVESEMSASSTLAVTDARGVTNGPNVSCTNGGAFDVSTNRFTAAEVLEDTESLCTATATDATGNEGTAILTVTMTPPPDIIAPTVSFNPATLTVISELTATATLIAVDDTAVINGPTVACTNGGTFDVSTNTFTAALVTAETESLCTATASDAVGNEGAAILTVTMKPEIFTTMKVRGIVTHLDPFEVARVEFDVSAATVTIDEENGLFSDIALGQIVNIEAEQSNAETFAKAFTITTEETLHADNRERLNGRSNSRETVVGQTIVGTLDTPRWSSGSNPREKIDGLRLENGNIIVTHIRSGGDESSDFEIHGTIADLDAIGATFRINNQEISYASVISEDFPENRAPENGDLIEVHGLEFEEDGTLIATRLEFEGDDDIFANSSQGEIGAVYGFVTNLTSPDSFYVNGVNIWTTPTTLFEGVDADALELNTPVSILGTFNADGTLIAETITREYISDTLLIDSISSINQSDQTLSIFGLRFIVDEYTQITNTDVFPIETVNFDSLTGFDSIGITGYSEFGSTDFVARDITIQNLFFEPGTFFLAPLKSVSGTELLFGHAITTTEGNPVLNLDNASEVDQETFLNAASNRIGDTMSAFGPSNGPRIDPDFIAIDKSYLSD